MGFVDKLLTGIAGLGPLVILFIVIVCGLLLLELAKREHIRYHSKRDDDDDQSPKYTQIL